MFFLKNDKKKNLITHKKFSKKCDQLNWSHIYSLLEMYFDNRKNKKFLIGDIDQLEKLVQKHKLLEKNIIINFLLTEYKKVLRDVLNNKEIVFIALIKQLFTNNSFDKESILRIKTWVNENYPDENFCLKNFHPDNEKKTK
jgi:hypothetical protein